MTYDYKILEEKFKQLPEEIQTALTSVEIAQAIKDISKKNGLRIDQESVLFDQTSYVLLGLMPSKDFVPEFMKETGVSNEAATAIGKDVNEKVFTQIKSLIRESQDTASSDETEPRGLSSLERVGNFTIEKEPSEMKGDVVESQTALIDGIENPKPTPPRPSEKKPVDIETHVDPIVDHLLASPVVTTETKIVQKEAVPAPTPVTRPMVTTPVKPSTDSYREPIE